MSSNQISGFGINVSDLDRSTEFFTRGLGLQEVGKYDLGHMHEVLVGAEGDAVSILLIKYTSRTEAPDIGTGYEKSCSCGRAAAYERAMAEGGTSELEPRTVDAMSLTVRDGARPRRLPDRTGQAGLTAAGASPTSRAKPRHFHRQSTCTRFAPRIHSSCASTGASRSSGSSCARPIAARNVAWSSGWATRPPRGSKTRPA